MRIKFSALLIGMLISTGLMAQKPSGYVLNEGDRFEVHSEIKQTVDQTIMGQVMQTKQTITSVEEYEVVAVTPTGYRLKNTALTKKLDLTSPQGSVVVDSEMEGDEHLAFKVMIGKSFFVEMDKLGKSLKLEGLEDLKSKIKTELAGTILEGQTDQIVGIYSEQTLTTAFDGQFHIYPEPGQTEWDRTSFTEINGLPITVDTKFSWDNDVTIFAAGDMSMEGDIQVQGMAMKASMSGTQNSIFDLDKSTGLSTLIQTLQDMTGELNVQGTSVPMTIKTEIKVTFTK